MWPNQGPPPPFGLQTQAYYPGYPGAGAAGICPPPVQYPSSMNPALMAPPLRPMPYGAPGHNPYPMPPYGAPGPHPCPMTAAGYPGPRHYPVATYRSPGPHPCPATPAGYPGVLPAHVHPGPHPHSPKWAHHKGHHHHHHQHGVNPTTGAIVGGMAVMGMGLVNRKAHKKLKKMQKKAHKGYKHGLHKHWKWSSSSSSSSSSSD